MLKKSNYTKKITRKIIYKCDVGNKNELLFNKGRYKTTYLAKIKIL